jgi:DNA polymerase-3 subunit alpha
MGLQVLGPDVNESHRKFGVNKKGDVRFGLVAVKGVGEGAVQNIIEEREKNGPFVNIYDFIERVNLSSCNKKVIESLALSGAFDNLGVRREPFAVNNEKGETFTEIILRYGAKFQIDLQRSTHSLFEQDAAIEIAKPEVFKCVEWSDLERLNREKELIGIYLSAHPLDAYQVILNYVCNTGMAEVSDLAELKNRDILLGGIVTKYREGTTKRGSPYGMITVEDFTGSGDIPLFGNDLINYGKYGRLGTYLYIRAVVESRYDNNSLSLKIRSIALLQDEKDKLVKKLSIVVPVSELTDAMVEELSELFRDNRGTTTLQFDIIDDEQNVSVNLHSKTHNVEVTQRIVDMLDDMRNILYKIN